VGNNDKTQGWARAAIVVLALCGAARLAYDEFWLRELILQVRADTAFDADMSKRCSQASK